MVVVSMDAFVDKEEKVMSLIIENFNLEAIAI